MMDFMAEVVGWVVATAIKVAVWAGFILLIMVGLRVLLAVWAVL